MQIPYCLSYNKVTLPARILNGILTFSAWLGTIDSLNMDIQYLSSKHFHQKGIADAFDNFENKEVTVSHSFRERHPFLKNQNYGEAFFKAVRKNIGQFHQVVEVGGGRGDLARGFINAWKRKPSKKPKSYTLLDLSPKLLRSQRKQIEPGGVLVNFVQGDAELFPFEDESLSGVVIANEMIADLDAWLITQTTRRSKTLRCKGRANNHFSTDLVRQTFRSYGFNRWLSKKTMIFPYGLALFLKSLHRAMRPGSSAILTEYFHLNKGGSVAKFHKHTESALNLDLVCMLARRTGFTVHVESLSEFLNLRITSPVMTRRFGSFLRDVLKLNCSTTLPYRINDIQRLVGVQGNKNYRGFFSESELNKFISEFYAVILTKHKILKPGVWSPGLVVKQDPTTIILRSCLGEPSLVMPHPFSCIKINSTGEFIWKRINGSSNIVRIATDLSNYYNIPYQSALTDTLTFIRKLHRRYFVY